MLRHIPLLIICSSFLVANLWLVAEEAIDSPTSEAAITTKINAAITQLDAENFSEREAASKMLADLGAIALPALKKQR